MVFVTGPTANLIIHKHTHSQKREKKSMRSKRARIVGQITERATLNTMRCDEESDNHRHHAINSKKK